MKKYLRVLVLSALLSPLGLVHAADYFADQVVDYFSGSGVSMSFTNSDAALGAPASGGSITPFAPPFSNAQIVSVGAGGYLTLHLGAPIVSDPSHLFGIDFIIFGNTFFAGSGTTTGALGGNNTGSTHVSVSADGSNWFTLNPALAPTVDGLFPTDGIGNPQIPVDPSLTASSFAGQNLAGIRSLYNGSAGGTGFALAWAQDGNGASVNLPQANYIRIDVLSGKSEVDAVAIVPEPGAASLLIFGTALALNFKRRR